MSVNPLLRLRALLPTPPLLLARVVAINADDTSLVELPLGLGQVSIANGVAVGVRLTVRGSSVPVNSNAFIRNGVIESKAPDGEALEALVGVVAAQPFGPARLAFAGPVVAPVATVGTPYTLDLAAFWTGGYPPLVFTVTGTLPAGLARAAGSGRITGTPTAAGTSVLQASVEDSSHRIAASGSFNLVVT